MTSYSSRQILAVSLVALWSCTERTTAPVARVRPTASASLTAVDGAPLETLFTAHIVRGSGAPAALTSGISSRFFETQFVLQVTSGDRNGQHRVSSADVLIDGRQALGPRDFNQQASAWSLPIALRDTDTISVTLAGGPESFLDVAIVGKRKAALFCPNGAGGAFSNMQSAEQKTPVDGTLFVCDGSYDVDSVTIDKPLTLRSLHPHGATLGDSDHPTTHGTGRPAVEVNGISTGVVRIADITFRANGRAVKIGGTWDQVVIDSVQFVGRNLNTSDMIFSGGSTVPGALLEVLRSRFDSMTIGVWATDDSHFNVHHSTFEEFSGGSVTPSTGFTTDGIATQATGAITDNVIRGCGATGCIRSFGNGVYIARNSIESTGPTSVGAAIYINRAYNRTGIRSTIVEDNVILGAPPSGDPLDPSSWSIQSAFHTIDGYPEASDSIRRNTIRNTHTAFLVESAPGQNGIVARDNTFSSGVYAFRVPTPFSEATIDVQRNDFGNFSSSFTLPGTIDGPMTLQCNWWGSPLGPTAPPPGAPASLYTPFAPAPIAGTRVACP